jgi:hypothetical protein
LWGATDEEIDRMLALRDQDIGGAVVTRAFRRGTEFVRQGTRLTREDVLAMPRANRNSMIDNGMLAVYPVAGLVAADPRPATRHVVSRGFGNFDVIEGRKLNDAPLTKEDAEDLAAASQQGARASA